MVLPTRLGRRLKVIMQFGPKEAEMEIERGEIQKALDGEVPALMLAFVWADSHDGHDFWEAQVDAGKLSDEGRKRLEEMLREPA